MAQSDDTYVGYGGKSKSPTPGDFLRSLGIEPAPQLEYETIRQMKRDEEDAVSESECKNTVGEVDLRHEIDIFKELGPALDPDSYAYLGVCTGTGKQGKSFAWKPYRGLLVNDTVTTLEYWLGLGDESDEEELPELMEWIGEQHSDHPEVGEQLVEPCVSKSIGT